VVDSRFLISGQDKLEWKQDTIDLIAIQKYAPLWPIAELEIVLCLTNPILLTTTTESVTFGYVAYF
jgi:hypothetical protein